MFWGIGYLVLGAGYWVLGYWVFGTGYWVFGTGYWVFGTGYWVLGTRYWVLGTRYWVLGTGYWVLGTVWVLGTGYWILGIWYQSSLTAAQHPDTQDVLGLGPIPTSWLSDQSGVLGTPHPVHKKPPRARQTLEFLIFFGPDATLKIS